MGDKNSIKFYLPWFTEDWLLQAHLHLLLLHVFALMCVLEALMLVLEIKVISSKYTSENASINVMWQLHMRTDTLHAFYMVRPTKAIITTQVLF